jgi:hypothetical protein
MNSLADSGEIFRYHRDMAAKYGAGNIYTLGWRDEESQIERFKVLAKIADLNHHSVLDGGCGHADLYLYLKNSYPNLGHYRGIEQIPELLDEAINRYGHLPETSFISGNFMGPNLPMADYILVCGSLNYQSSDPEFIYKAISRLFQHSNLGFGFNLLSSVGVPGLLVTYNPQHILNYCQTLSQNVILKDDYSNEDFTIFMYH